ncbi:MAG: HipA domain-containing protein [Deltaproteobacteria bacterium]|nr:HipA domain-containing protein [Deltaproteobacteria bacterium]
MTERCLSCHKPELEMDGGYHLRCARKLFGTKWVPIIPFSSSEIVSRAQKMVGKISISGVQPKLSVHLDRKRKILDVVEEGGNYILKPQVERFKSLPENENLCMNIAEALAIETPPHGLLMFSEGDFCYMVKRFDRLPDGGRLPQEDFQQLTGIEDKYAGSMEKAGKALLRYSEAPGLDMILLFERLLLFFLLGNGDAHLKNFSLLKKPDLGYRLSPIYDIVNSRLVIPAEQEEMSLSINGKRNRLAREDFLTFAAYMDMPGKTVDRTFEKLKESRDLIIEQIDSSFLPDDLKIGFGAIFGERWGRLFD